jgi:hypothetical protein
MEEEKTGSVQSPRSKFQSYVHEREQFVARRSRRGRRREGFTTKTQRHQGEWGRDMRRLSRLGPGFHAQAVDFQPKRRKTSDYVALCRFRNVAKSHMRDFAGSEVFPHGQCAPRKVIARFCAQVVDFLHIQVRNSKCGVRNGGGNVRDAVESVPTVCAGKRSSQVQVVPPKDDPTSESATGTQCSALP